MSDRRIQTVCLMILAGVAGIFMVYWLRPVLVPFVVACFIVSGVGPILSYFEERFNVSRVVAAGMAFLFGVALMGIFGLTISLSIIDLANNAKDYRNRVRQLVDRVDDTFSTDFLEVKLFGRSRNDVSSDEETTVDDAEVATGASSGRSIPEANPSDQDDSSDNGTAVDKATESDERPSSESPRTQTDEGEPNTAATDQEESTSTSSDDSAADDPSADEKVDGVVAEDSEESTDEGAESEGDESSGDEALALAQEPTDATLPETDTVRVHSRANPVSSSRMQEATELVDAFVRDGISVVLQSFLNLVSTSIVVLIYVFFLLLGKPEYVQTGTMREIDTQIRGYLSLKTVISIGTGAVFGLALRLFGVPMALSFGVLAFLLNFIPNIGPIVASLLPIPLILLDPSGNIWWMISVIIVTSMIQLISGNVVEPKLMGNSSDLHPVTILLGLMFWGMMWGIIGMFLATPITAAMKIVLERFEPTHQIANIMAGRWDSIESDLSKATGGQ